MNDELWFKIHHFAYDYHTMLHIVVLYFLADFSSEH